ncbi:DUF1402 family protein [Rhizobium oryzicola]|uniref:DUF1402 family protein n=1 Tax=Rhizobium oryzicola TaxID=1232668 RepID=A0ABT8T1Q2_9HYPH|nr:DUF1402 family protein [Rhizobium oryzicola]MDO1584684.1 DUF1402 family protein [Rhizobium oryzicola]
MRPIVLALMMTLALSTSQAEAGSISVMPPGNRNAEQPKIPGASTRRTRDVRTTFDDKYERIRDLLASDKSLMSKIKQTARQYDIDPIHIIGAIIGEHTYNVDAYDRLQSYYIKAASYAGDSFRFGYKGMSVGEFVSKSQFDQCKEFTDSYRLWSCREDVWEKAFRDKTVDGVSYPDNRFSAVFFQPFYAGQTFGLGQLNPLTALMHADMVSKVSGYPKLEASDAQGVYKAIMDPDKTLAYMAATIKRSIDDYADIAGIDISKNPGITATLYNVGNSAKRAAALAAKNRSGGFSWPQENYYGWLVNDKLDELKSLL